MSEKKKNYKWVSWIGIGVGILINLLVVLKGYNYLQFQQEQNTNDIKELKEDVKNSDIGIVKNEIKHINKELKEQSESLKDYGKKIDKIHTLLLDIIRNEN